MWFLIVFIIYFFVVVIIRLLLSTLLVDLLHQTYPWPIRGLRFVQNVSMFWMNPIIVFPELSISRFFFVKMWLFHEKLFLPIIYHIVYRNFAWHVFFNGCFCQKIIIICNNNILVSRKKNYFDFLICFFQLHLSTPSQEFNREEAESQRRIMDGSPPTPRSLRLDPRSAGHLSASQEELRR